MDHDMDFEEVTRPMSVSTAVITPSVSNTSRFGSSGMLSPDGTECYGNERQAFSEQIRFYNNETLSDVTLKVGYMTYFAHKIVLCRASDVFERMFSSDWSSTDSKEEVELVEDTVCEVYFPRFLRFLYGCRVVLSSDSCLPILILADKYNIQDLRSVCVNFVCSHIIPRLQLKDVFHIWFQYSTKCYHHTLIAACIRALAVKMDEIMASAEWEKEWIDLNKDQLIEFISSSDLCIKDENSLWQAVIQWLEGKQERQDNYESLLGELIKYVRFPMMSPEQLCEIEMCLQAREYPDLFLPRLMEAFKYQSLPLNLRSMIDNPRGYSSFLLRNYVDLRWDKRLVIRNYSDYQKGSEISLRFSTRSSSVPTQTWEWELKCYPKGTSNSDDFRCLLFSNFILEQPRPVEFQFSITNDKEILFSVTGKKNFSKNRYSVDTEIDKKVTVEELLNEKCNLVDNCLVFQVALKPVE